MMKIVSWKNSRGVLALILLLQILVFLFLGVQKQGYFIDEVYTYGLANGYYKPFMNSYPEMFDHWNDGKAIEQDYMTVQPGEQFAFASVYDNQARDVHPPLHYELVHAVCSFFPNACSKWFGLAINLVFYLGASILLYLVAIDVLGEERLALASVAIWSFGAGVLSLLLYIRMYMMLSFLTIAMIAINLQIRRKGISLRRCAALLAVAAAGCLTQYYFVVFAFFYTAVNCLRLMAEKKWKAFFAYGFTMLGAVAAALAIFPACITQLTRKDEFVAEATRKNMMNPAVFKQNLLSYVYSLNAEFLDGKLIVVAVAVLALVVMLGMRIVRRRRNVATDTEALWLLVAAVLSVATIAAVAVVPSSRYISNLYAPLILGAVWMLKVLFELAGVSIRILAAGLAAICCLFSVGAYRDDHIGYLYPDEPALLAIADQYSDKDCLYVTDDRNAPMTQDIMTLAHLKRFYALSEEKLGREHLTEILKGSTADLSVAGCESQAGEEPGLVVTVDTNAYWSSGYDAGEVLEKIMAATGLFEYQFLFQRELTATYYLSK